MQRLGYISFAKGYEYVTRFTMLNLIFDIAHLQQEVLKGNYISFKYFCSSMSVEANNNKELVIIQINNSYVVGSKSFRPDIQKPRQMENAVTAI